MRTRWWLTGLASSLLVFATAARAAERSEQREPQLRKPIPQSRLEIEQEKELLRLFADTLAQIKSNYVDTDISERDLVEAAIRGMLAKLDPYTNYIPPEALDRFQRDIKHQFGGIGIQVTMRDGKLVIISPMFGTPAHRAGLHPGDIVVKIGNTSTKGITLDAAIQLMKGPVGSTIDLTVLRPTTDETKHVTLPREVIHIPSVLGYRIKPNDQWDYLCDAKSKIGYVRLTAFSERSASELAGVLKKLLADGMQGLILDLRFNPGGLLSEAIQIADLFLRKGEITSTQSRNTPRHTWNAQAAGTLLPAGLPIAVLVNRYSASASEIVSACLQDHQIATIIGERTWGKGSVQNIVKLERGKSALKLTTGSYRRPSGKNIHRRPGASDKDDWGVKPNKDMTLRLSAPEMRALNTHFHQLDIIGAVAKDKKTAAQPKSDFTDIQLQKAIEVLRARIKSKTEKKNKKANIEP